MAKTIDIQSDFDQWKARQQGRKLNESALENVTPKTLMQALLEMRQEIRDLRQEIHNLQTFHVRQKGGRPSSKGGVHEVRSVSGGDVVTYFYRYRGGPRITENEARRIIAEARKKAVPFTKPVP